MSEGVTPFGDSVNLAWAFAQQLMFPGEYTDVETGDSATTVLQVEIYGYIVMPLRVSISHWVDVKLPNPPPSQS